ncbi:MAG: hypothetical protein OXF41_12275 [bacterium]|nr:hypothetical protein [bacterium]
MRTRTLPVLFAAAAILLTACGGDGEDGNEGGGAAESETTVSTFGQFADRAELPTVVYDGQTCTYIGPETVDPGPVRMTLDNRSGIRARIDILRFPEGKTFEDLAAYVESGEAATNQDSPDWVDQTRKIRAPANQLMGANRTLFDNTYGILCYIGETEPFEIQAVATFEVLEG